jgi:HEAT repeat protein
VPRTFGQKTRSSPAGAEAKLIAVLKSDAPQKAKADACRELARVGTRDAVAPLAALLGDEKLSHMARYGLEPIPDPAVDAALRDALGKLKGRLLVGVIGSLGVRRDHHAVAPLTKYLQDSDPEVVQASARALGRIGTIEASKALETALSKTSEANRLACYEGLFRCADTLRSQGQRDQARAIYEELRAEKAPPQVRAGASRAADAIRPR